MRVCVLEQQQQQQKVRGETANENKVDKQINNPEPGMVIITIAFNCEGNS